ncbi:MAG: copper chaperone PCu(A)C [Xanthomonadaceae bacterium]|nr:copper chaperone PCu(A)C [Xanthomonadaceae bacterium]
MKLRAALATVLFAVAATATAAASSPAGVRVREAWIRWLPADLPAGGYIVIENKAGTPERLVGASSPDYGMVMLHRSQEVDGADVMTAVSGIDIPAHGSFKLAPGGYHLMLMHAKRAIKPGDKVPVILHFAGGAMLQVDFPVLPANASAPPD